MSHVILWTYDVAPENEAAFIAAYGPNGGWAKLFARGDGFIGVELHRAGLLFLTIDRWQSPAAFEVFQANHGADYAALDAELAHLSTNQRRLGAFDAL